MTTPHNTNGDPPEKPGIPTTRTTESLAETTSADMDVETMGDDELALRIDYSSFDEDPSGASWLGTGFTTLREELDALGIEDGPLDYQDPTSCGEPDMLTLEGMKGLLTEPQFEEPKGEPGETPDP